MLSISRQRNMLNLTLVCGRPVQKKVSKTKVSKQENIYKFHNHNTSCGRFLSEKPMQRLETMSNMPFRNQCRILLAKSFQHVMQKSFTPVSKSNMKIVRPASFVPKLDSLTTVILLRVCTRCAKEFGFAHPGRTFLVSLLRVEHLRQPSHAFMSTYFFLVSPAKHIFRRIRFTKGF